MSENLERTTRLVCQLLDDVELSALYLAVMFNGDPRVVAGYQKAKSLFNQASGTRMSPPVQDVFEAVVNERLNR